MGKRAIVGKKDWLFFVAVLLAVFLLTVMLFFRGKNKAVTCSLYCGDQKLLTVDLTKNGTFSLPDYPGIVFEVRDGAVRFLSSDCPDKICVHTGFIRTAGQYAVCLPYKLSLRIDGKNAPDAVTGHIQREAGA